MAEYSKNLGEGKKVVSSNDKNSQESNILNIESSTLAPLEEATAAKDVPEKLIAKEREVVDENTTKARGQDF